LGEGRSDRSAGGLGHMNENEGESGVDDRHGKVSNELRRRSNSFNLDPRKTAQSSTAGAKLSEI
jgi:hypothetical protein